ncbi:hypothetical protein NQ317_018905 [Molorchus minor]|uniref:Uncharacterized protein n=1 Tax=Molorchus minor TaxID=1323400 RepID=A0ABQ9JNI8_9CUCU|nr:hypothetical protein NQ317_018905 [Molorchus minor]
MENEDIFLDTVLKFHKEDRWKDILKLNEKSDKDCAIKILWVWPSEENLDFLRKICDERNIQGVISVGCGSGLLEWILSKSLGLDVVGYEINKQWWESKYSVPTFIKLRYHDQSVQENVLDPRYALLFCYFNNGPAFLEYIDNYKGNTVIIIGPSRGAGRHTDPEPFKANFGGMKWRLYGYQEVKDTKDFIVVYVRLCDN